MNYNKEYIKCTEILFYDNVRGKMREWEVGAIIVGCRIV